MNSRFPVLAALLVCLLPGCQSATPHEADSGASSRPTMKPFPWPRGARAAVSLTYDDAIPSQLDNAAPALDRHGLRATFFLTGSSPTLERSPERFRALVEAGHELGSHTIH